MHQNFVQNDGAYDDWFGISVAIYDNTFVVGAYRDDDKGYDSGSVYVYSQFLVPADYMC